MTTETPTANSRLPSPAAADNALAELINFLHTQAIDTRALIEANRWSEARTALDRLIERLDVANFTIQRFGRI